jgi:elongation factor 1-alpha
MGTRKRSSSGVQVRLYHRGLLWLIIFNFSGAKLGEVKLGDIFYNATARCPHKTDFFKVCILFRDHIPLISATSGIVFVKGDWTPDSVECQVAEISETIDRETGKVLELNPKYIEPGQICRMVFVPLEPVYLESYSDFPELGRVKVKDGNKKKIGSGIIVHVEYRK